tara:strand:+ start:1072 stop:1650 length:579 start_codon:yes stop_codon:yes gene_type:complete
VNYDLRSYVKVYKKFLNKETCEDTLIQLKQIEFTQHQFYDHSKGKTEPRSGKYELDYFTDYNNNKVKNSNFLIENIWHGIKQYQTDLNLPWYDSWEGFSAIKYNRYTENKKMALHIDHIKSLFEGEKRGIPILTCLGLLNNDYLGGEFIMWGDEIVDLRQGDMVIFPSNFMYPHQVAPVQSGTRYSYISWVW